MISRNLTAIAAGSMVLALVGGTVNADVIEATFDSVEPGMTINYTLDGGGNFSESRAGTFNWTRTGGDYAGGGAVGNFTTYCIELTQQVGYGNNYSYIVADPADAPVPGAGMGQAKADLLAELFGTFHRDDFTQQEAVGFQTAVWEIVNDDGVDLAAGDFQVTDSGVDYFDIAQGWLNALDGTGSMATLVAMTSRDVQDHIFMVPAPASMSLALLGLFAVSRRRRRTD